MLILAIESSCDETSLALLEGPNFARQETLLVYINSWRVVHHLISSQIQTHLKYGGVIPEIGAREHAANIHKLLEILLNEADLKLNQTPVEPESQDKTGLQILNGLDTICVTTNPGLISALRVGMETAKAIQFFIQVKFGKKVEIIEVNHLFGHLASCFYQGNLDYKTENRAEKTVSDSKTSTLHADNGKKTVSNQSVTAAISTLYSPLQVDVAESDGSFCKNCCGFDFNPAKKRHSLFPHLHLLVSGGNSQLILMTGPTRFEIIGQTLDDAAGECLDKIGRMLGLPYPGGVWISKIAKLEENNPEKLPIGMQKSGDLDYSFSGLKTAVRYKVQKQRFKSWKFEQKLSENELKMLTRFLEDNLNSNFESADQNRPNSGSKNHNFSLQEEMKTLNRQNEGTFRGNIGSNGEYAHLNFIYNLAVSAQTVVISQLINKFRLAVDKFSPASVGLSGGVSANPLLRRKFSEIADQKNINTFIPNSSLSGDNAVMIGLSGILSKVY